MSPVVDHPTRFVAPRPLWPALDATVDADRRDMQAPVLLSFETDDFMGTFDRTLGDTDRARRAGILAAQRVLSVPGGTAPILYQPAHGCFYLATVSLVCHQPGLPDRAVMTNRGETISFLLRRIHDGVERAFVEEPGKDPYWMAVDDVVPNARERRLSSFPVVYDEGDLRRRVLATLVPVSGFEELQRVAEATAVGEAGITDATVGFELASIGDAIGRYLDELPPPVALPARRAVILALGQLPDLLDRSGYSLEDFSEGLRDVVSDAEELLVELGAGGGELPPDFPPAGLNSELSCLKEFLQNPDKTEPETPSDELFLTDPNRATYVIRALYEKPGCPSALDQVLSPPSECFTLGAFFEPDAPSRPIQVTLPFDTSPAGLKKFPHNVSFVFSDQLHQQIEKIRGLTNFDEIGDDPTEVGPTGGLGVICSLSIPIVTIVALVVLMIVASILHIIFFWLPYLMICRPKVGA